ncbi:MAG: VCBS repeat-containing protein [Planktotalea sp.]|uniref:FG-GAP repeat domain-containing protein n=1 Tax=Planktotalea sp. TaxID=2029877 RepID=UPI003C70DDBA
MRFAALAAVALCAASAAQAGIKEARFSAPTTRYDHGVLGDAIEFGTLVLTTDAGRSVTLKLPETRVFEDIAPRLVDVDLDGDNEVVVIETSIAKGARLSIYDESGLIAATPYIGQTHRWLAPVGAADFDGDGYIELAYIDRPHLARTLRIWRFKDGALEHVLDQAGLTNHRIGDALISGGVRRCGTPEMINMNSDWSKIMSSTFENGRITTQEIGPYKGYSSSQEALLCN